MGRGAGRLFVHCDEWFEGAGDYVQYKLFMRRRCDRTFVLRAKERPDVSCRLSMNFYTHASEKLRELEIVVPPDEYAKMVKGVTYTLHPTNGTKGYEWKVGAGVAVKRE